MADDAIAARLKAAREQKFKEAQEAASALGVPYPTYAGHENGNRGFKRDSAKRYADFFRVNLEWLMTGRGAMRGKVADIIPIVGRVGAATDGAIAYAGGDGEFGYVPRPIGAPDNTVAVEIHGGSMGYLADGSIVIYSERFEAPLPDMLGQVVIVSLADGRVLLKRLLRGSEPHLWDLESVNGPVLPDQRVEWFSHVDYIVPPWRASQLKIPA